MGKTERSFAIEFEPYSTPRFMSSHIRLEDLRGLAHLRRREIAGRVSAGVLRCAPNNILHLVDRVFDFPSEQNVPFHIGPRIGYGCTSEVYALRHENQDLNNLSDPAYVAKRIRFDKGREENPNRKFPISDSAPMEERCRIFSQEYSSVAEEFPEFVVPEYYLIAESTAKCEPAMYVIQPYVSGCDIFTPTEEMRTNPDLQRQMSDFVSSLNSQMDAGYVIDILNRGNVVFDEKTNKVVIRDPHAVFKLDQLNKVDQNLLNLRLSQLNILVHNNSETEQPTVQAAIFKDRWLPFAGGEITRREMIGYPKFDITIVGENEPPSEHFPNPIDYVQVVPDFTIFGRSLVLSATMRRIERDLREKGINIFVLDQPSGLADLVKIAHMTPEMLAQSLIYWGNDVREIGKDRPPWFQAFKRAVTAEVANKVKGHLGETNGVLESLRTIGVEEGKLHKIKPPMGFPDGELTYEVRRRFLQDNEGGVLFPIRLAKEKNVGVLPQYLESLSNALSAQVSDTNPKRVCVTIVGPEQDREILALVQGLEKQYDGKGNVRFQYKGTLPPNEMWQAYRTHAVTIMPAKSEGFGRGTIEALYYGSVPIVNKECPASCEVVGDCGMKVADDAFASQAATVTYEILNHPEVYEEMRRRGLEQAAQYTIPLAEQSLIDALKKMGLIHN